MSVWLNGSDGQKIEYITIAEGAELADRSKDAVRDWIQRGLLDAHRDKSGRWLIRRGSLEDYLRGPELST